MKDAIRQIDVGGYPFSVEVVETPEERATGLMGRKYLHDGTGMLFKMEGGPAQFHMKNTLIPLDILYLDDHGTVIKKDRMHPHTGRSHCDADVHNVLEFPAGTCDMVGIDEGDQIGLSDVTTLRDVVHEVLLYKQNWISNSFEM